tara:strand:+ start:1165 stop:1482 length:318 start_codon:yes stop_codon:yes gene_type:complete
MDKPKTARSYRSNIIDDNAVISINLKWLGQILILLGGIVYGYWRMETRIINLEKEVAEADLEIEKLVQKHIHEEDEKIAQLQEQLKWYETELNLNPLSWRKKKKK